MARKRAEVVQLFDAALDFAKREKYHMAIRLIEKTLSIDPDYSEARYGLGLIYLLVEDRSSALRQCEVLGGLNQRLKNRLSEHINSNGHAEIDMT